MTRPLAPSSLHWRGVDMTRSEKKYVMAPEHKHARHYAESMEWKRSEWEYLSRPEQLKGLYGVVLYDVRIPRANLGSLVREKAVSLREAVIEAQEAGRIVRTNVVNLP